MCLSLHKLLISVLNSRLTSMYLLNIPEAVCRCRGQECSDSVQTHTCHVKTHVYMGCEPVGRSCTYSLVRVNMLV